MRVLLAATITLFMSIPSLVWAGSDSSSSSATILFQYDDATNWSETNVVSADNGSFYGNSYNGHNHATIFRSSGTTLLTPSQFTQSFIYGGAEGIQVGYAPDKTAHFHPLVWSGTSTSAVDLLATSLGMTSGVAYGCSATNVVGVETGFGNGGAALWTSRSATSVVDLGANLGSSQANACYGNQQVGIGQSGSSTNDAYLWNGTAASGVDLSPHFGIQTNQSDAFATNGTQQGGEAQILFTPGTSYEQAMLWSGTAASAVNLNPSGAAQSCVLGMSATMQVGWAGYSAQSDNAYEWSGTAASGINLGLLLPASDTWISSQALSISASNVIYGTATDSNHISFAVEWTLTSVPEPTSAVVLFAAIGFRAKRRRPRRFG